jgi:hypothetical protein
MAPFTSQLLTACDLTRPSAHRAKEPPSAAKRSTAATRSSTAGARQDGRAHITEHLRLAPQGQRGQLWVVVDSQLEHFVKVEQDAI